MKKSLKILLLVCSLIICSVSAVACSSLSDTVDQLLCSHVYDDGVVTKETSCAEPGTFTKTCTLCGKTENSDIALLEHVYDEVVTKEASCSELGILTKTCTLCDKTETSDIALLEHVPLRLSPVDSTCTKTGKTDGVICEVCDEIIVAQQEVPAKGHVKVVDYGKAATCLESGITDGSHCSVCDLVLVEQAVIPATGHDLVNILAVEPTCTRTGYPNYSRCETCDAHFGYEKLDKLGHNVVDGCCTRCAYIEGSEYVSLYNAYESSSKYKCVELKVGDTVSLNNVFRLQNAEVSFSLNGVLYKITPAGSLTVFPSGSVNDENAFFAFFSEYTFMSEDTLNSILTLPLDTVLQGEPFNFDISGEFVEFTLSSTDVATIEYISSLDSGACGFYMYELA